MNDDTAIKDQAAWDAADKVADYEHGWSSDIETDFAPKGLNEDTVRFISAKKNEPEWMLEWRLKAFAMWKTMTPPDWAKLNVPPIDYQDAYYYAAPKAKPKLGSLDEVDPEILRVYEKLGIPIAEQKLLAGVESDLGESGDGGLPARRVAVDAVFDSVSVATTFRAELERAGVIFRSISEAIRNIPTSSVNGSARSFRCATIISRRSTARSFPTGRSSTSLKACDARWSFPPISASTLKIPDSLNAR
jgi:Fe-S cluster assembly protein SufB